MGNQLPNLSPKWRASFVGLFTGFLCYLINNAFLRPVDFEDVMGPVIGTALASSGHLDTLLRRQAKGEE